MKISDLTSLTHWFIKYYPKELILGKRSQLRKIREFNPENTNMFWRHFKGRPVIYE